MHHYSYSEIKSLSKSLSFSWYLSADYWLTRNQVISLLIKMNALSIHFNVSFLSL